MDALFTTKYLDSKVEVYQNIINWYLAGKLQSILVSEVSSIDIGNPLETEIVLKTTRDKEIRIPVNPNEKNQLADIILNIEEYIPVEEEEPIRHNDINELKKQRDHGLITEEEFIELSKECLRGM